MSDTMKKVNFKPSTFLSNILCEHCKNNSKCNDDCAIYLCIHKKWECDQICGFGSTMDAVDAIKKEVIDLRRELHRHYAEESIRLRCDNDQK
jgi:hypothetical protein